ncbi:bifunctional 3'-5' exonuclease/DNA polymerase [Tersicoccus solisilvae]|uniref:DNA-directed DNA polymerase n=1 Tax=Tersicoccus solisilvae TaxID=1882339 RepID=A0ABQ1NVA7_9MICC|nr:bifunctional 3'-5' exonuclease/DNA polymerase [Tersicoccus solisilvae]GGC80947.1 bifunctional 3'-5' exonuclease/DNA polymerase [Tersicoccus solisilvae]
MYTVVARDGDVVLLQDADDAGSPTGSPQRCATADVVPAVARREAIGDTRWVFARTTDWYPRWLRGGVTVARSHDLGLSGQILGFSQDAAAAGYAPDPRLAPRTAEDPDAAEPRDENQAALFEPAPAADQDPSPADLVAELGAQLAAVATSAHPGRLRLLLAAESAGALAGAEMHHAGLPFRADLHDAYLRSVLGPRVPHGQRPQKLAHLAGVLQEALGAPTLNPDSPQDLLRALHRAGIEVATTRKGELARHSHPAIAPLLEYKALSRLLTANGWAWQDAWVRDGRFRPDYVVGAVVTGRWATSGGGALQIPHQIRAAAHADPGHRLVVADAAQLEPRVLAAIAVDDALAAAARGRDLYAGVAERGFGGERSAAKVAMLGAMYGATTGEAGRLVPQLARSFPRAVALVEAAARLGEAGRPVSTHLGRSSPPAGRRVRTALARGDQPVLRANGRFTRNFVVQGSAAEWALCWLADLRRRLRDQGGRARLVFFVHDELVLHVPDDEVDVVVEAVRDAAAAASALLFGAGRDDFPVSVAVVDSYDQAK